MFNNSVTLKNEATADGANDVMEISGDEDEVDESTENGENPVGEGEASTENSESTE